MIEVSAIQIAQLIGAEIQGNPDVVIRKFDNIEDAAEGSLSFIANPKYEVFAETTNASVLLVRKDFQAKVGSNVTLLKVSDPYTALAFLLGKLQESEKVKKTGIHELAFIAEGVIMGEDVYCGPFVSIGRGAKLGKQVQLYPGVQIGEGVEIGDHSILYPNAVVYAKCKIGKHCILHSGVVIGSDGFGFAPQKDGSYLKVPQTGVVVIDDHVEIGANTVIDRATLGETKIHKGVKLDNLVQIAHNVEIGEHTVIAAQAGVSGSTKLGKYVMVGGQAGFVGHIRIADKVKVNAQSGVSKSVTEEGRSLTGSPAMDFRDAYKLLAQMKQISSLEERIKNLELELQRIQQKQ